MLREKIILSIKIDNDIINWTAFFNHIKQLLYKYRFEFVVIYWDLRSNNFDAQFLILLYNHIYNSYKNIQLKNFLLVNSEVADKFIALYKKKVKYIIYDLKKGYINSNFCYKVLNVNSYECWNNKLILNSYFVDENALNKINEEIEYWFYNKSAKDNEFFSSLLKIVLYKISNNYDIADCIGLKKIEEHNKLNVLKSNIIFNEYFNNVLLSNFVQKGTTYYYLIKKINFLVNNFFNLKGNLNSLNPKVRGLFLRSFAECFLDFK